MGKVFGKDRTGREGKPERGYEKRGGYIALAAGAGLLAAAGVLQLAARRTAGFGQWYAVTVYPWIVGIYGRICGIFPFSVAEICLYLLIICIAWYIASQIRRMAADPSARTAIRVLGEAGSRFLLAAGILAFLYTACCGVNYYRRPFSDYLGLEVRASSVEELRTLCEFLTDRVNEAAGAADSASAAMTKGRAVWEAEGRRAMEGLALQYPQLDGYYPLPKGLRVSWILSVQQLSGIYSPFTVEANYNRDMTGYNIPHTICHELSHLRGFMREDEANFIGYLACIRSSDQSFQYSGYLSGWIYAGNALASQDPAAYQQICARLDPRVMEDLRANNAFWNRYESKVSEAANQMNDTYLKLNSQSEGVRSYGRMVDLMLAYYRE